MVMLFVLVVRGRRAQLDRGGGRDARRTRGAEQRRPAWLLGDPLRVQLDRGEQRQRVRRADGSDVLLQHDASAFAMLIGRFAMMVPMLALGRVPLRAEDGSGVGRDVPGHDAALRRAAARRHPDRRRALTFFPALSLGPIVEHLLMQAGQALLSIAPWPRLPVHSSTRRSSAAPPRDSFIEARAAPHGAEPRDVRRAHRQRAHHARARARHRDADGASIGFTLQITLWLWFTVLFANFAEAMAEGRGKAQADTLRRARTQTQAKQLPVADRQDAMSTTVRRRRAAQGRPRAVHCPAT